MTIVQSLTGMLTVELTCADPEKVLDAILGARIPLFHVEKTDDLSCRLLICRNDYPRLLLMGQKQGASWKILKQSGLFWNIRALFSRPVLLCLILMLFVSSWYLPSRIFFVTVEGNAVVPARLILSAAEDCGIRFGASRKLVRSEKVKNALLSAVPQLQWAGVNTFGCNAVISVRERVPEEEPREDGFVSNLVAHRDGYILSATVTGGTAHVVPGQTVTEGQLLISGYTDCGICIRASRAEGEILAQTRRKITAVMPETQQVSTAAGNAKYGISLLLGKKRINLWKDSRISDACCGRMYTEYYLSLPGGFRLPAAVCVDRYLPYELQETKILPADAQRMLRDFSERAVLRQMVAGQIIGQKENMTCADGLYRLDGSYVCTEMIGREQREQIGVINGKRN